MTNKHLYLWLCALIFIVAFGLRMAQPDLVEFKRDEATVARLGQAIAYEGYRPAVGVDSSVGIDNLPLTLYLMAIPLRINPDPLSAVFFTTFLNAIAVVICYWLTQRSAGTPAALIAASLFAVNPWALLYARKIWCRVMPLFTLGFIVSSVAVFIWGKRWALVGAFVSVAALIGLQLEGIAFIPVFLLLLLVYRDKVAWQPFAVGVVLCALLFLPYIAFDAGQDWVNLKGLLNYGGGGAFSWDAVRYAFSLAGTAGIEGQTGGLYEQFKHDVPNLWFINSLVSLVLGVGLIHACVQVFSADFLERRRFFSLLLIWFIVPVLLQLRPSSATQRHYFVLLYPVQFILISAVLVDGMTWFRRKMKDAISKKRKAYQILFVCLGVFSLIWVGFQITVTFLLRSYMVDHPTTGGYGIPLRYTRQIAQKAIGLTVAAEVIVVGDSTRPMMTETPTVFDALLYDQPHRFVDGRGALLFPAHEKVVYIVTLFPGEAKYPSLVGELADFPSVTQGPKVQLPGGDAFHTFLRVSSDTADVASNFLALSDGIPFSNNVVFSGYRTEGELLPGEYIQVWLGWWLHGPPPGDDDYHFTVQLHQIVDGGNKVVSQDDQVAFPAEYWQEGDMVISYFLLPIPSHLQPGSYVLRAGMYSYPDITSVPVINAAGQTVEQGVQLVEYLFDN